MNFDPSRAPSLSVNTSASLLERVKARDDVSWGKLLNLYSPMIYRWARKADLQAFDAQDVVQNVFLAVASDIDNFRRSQPGDSFRGWLWTICRHKILDRFREKNQEAQGLGRTSQQSLEQMIVPELNTHEMNSDRSGL